MNFINHFLYPLFSFVRFYMKISWLFLLLLFFCGCSGLRIPESNEDPNDPNHGPILLKAGELDYPQLMEKTALEGIIGVELAIDTSGTVTDVEVLERKFNADAVYTAAGKYVYIKDLVDEPVINFYKGCKFLPALKKGRPVKSVLRTAINFKISK